MFPLLDLYINLDNKIKIEQYKKILLDFEKLWGMHVHIFSDNLNNYLNLEDLLNLLEEMNIKYALQDGIFNNKFNNIDITFKNIVQKNFTSLCIIINKQLLKDNKYITFIRNTLKNDIKLEVYFKANKQTIDDLEDIVNFCNENSLKLCIVDIDKKYNELKISKLDYKKLLDEIEIINNKKNVKISIAECPYLSINNENFKDFLGGCSGGITSCMIDKTGNIILCYYLDDVIIGNINESTLEDVWENSDILNKLRDRKNLKGKCSKCKYILCCGGCRAESYFKYKDLFNEDSNCWIGD